MTTMATQQRQQRETEYGDRKSHAKAMSKSDSRSALKLPDGVEMFDLKDKKGNTKIDIIGYRVGKGHPTQKEGRTFYTRQYSAHANVGIDGKSVVCPRETFGERCPICENFAERKRKGDDWDSIKDLKPKTRMLYNVIDLSLPKKAIKVWDVGFFKSFGQKLEATIDLDDSNESFYHLKGGKTLVLGVIDDSFNKGGKSQAFKKVEAIQFIARPDYPEKVLDRAVCLDDCLVKMDYDELRKMYFEEYAEGDHDEEDDDFGSPVPSANGSSTASTSGGADSDWGDDDAPAPKKGKKTAEEPPEPDDDDPPFGISVGDKVSFEYKDKSFEGKVEKINTDKGLAYVEVEGKDKPATVALADLTKIEDEPPAPKGKKGTASKKKAEEDDDSPFGGDDDDADKPAPKKGAGKKKAPPEDDDWGD